MLFRYFESQKASLMIHAAAKEFIRFIHIVFLYVLYACVFLCMLVIEGKPYCWQEQNGGLPPAESAALEAQNKNDI